MSSDRTTDTDLAVRLEGVGKCFQIYEQPHHRLLQGLFRSRKQFFREFWALKDISLDIRTSDTVGIIGRNGAGKSTLLQIICGTLAQTCGSVDVNGRVAALLELGAGFNPEFTGRENVFMSGAVLGLSREEVESKFDQITTFADIGEFIEQPVKTYSSGMYVRLAFAVISHVDADVLVIDEALAVGDVFFAQKCMRFLRQFSEKGTLLFVSHDTSSVVNFCDKAIWLDQGAIKLAGSAKDVTESYLEGLYEAKQGESIKPVQPMPQAEQIVGRSSNDSDMEFRDQRLSLINSSPYRNDLKIFKFDERAASFGKGGARIVNVKLYDDEGKPLNWVVGGENVTLKIKCEAAIDIGSPIIGFYVKDKLGQILFGDNTYITYQDDPLPAKQGQSFQAEFRFRMPVLRVGDYSVSVAIADGAQDEHVQHHWVHDALMIKAQSSSVCFGLFGVMMTDIRLRVSSA
jgi:lipopolysaccharide transport system ATP-binding protein